MPPKTKKTISEKDSDVLSTMYQKLSDIEHVLKAPDTYIGSTDKDKTTNWILNSKNTIEHKDYTWIPGLYKCFDEGLVNARDHFIRMLSKNEDGVECHPVKNISVEIDKETGMITIMNDGNGIDVAKHPEHDMWIPEMIFGHLRTSTNYDQNQKKIVGGKNGFGFKLVLIYSLFGRIETVDHTRGLKYIQEFKNNLSEICKPSVTKSKVKPYTKVSFIPDFKRFGCERLSSNMFDLMKKRVYDISAVTDKSVKVSFNKEVIPIKNFEQYVSLYIGNNGTDNPRAYEKINERWEYSVCLSPQEEFTHVSFVNGINTGKGGTHVTYILNQIVRKLISYIETKKKVKVKSSVIKEQLMIFLNCVVENPAFDSQSKDYLNTPVAKFGSSAVVSDKVIDKLAKMGVMKTAISLNEVKQSTAAKKTDGKKSKTIRGIPKLIDANYAGGPRSSECTLILCEGDSAKSGIVSGMSREDRNTIGVYPLKGKPMNVRDVSMKKILENVENSELKQIMGLVTGKVYKKEDIASLLRYGKVLFMTDQDLDGIHIKGLCINLIQTQWKELIQFPQFIGFMNTPILKATKGIQSISFYSQGEYDAWKETQEPATLCKWKIKYYKGLGTSTGKEFKEYFENKKVVSFKYTEEGTNTALDLVFDKSMADERKEWLGNFDKSVVLDTSRSEINYEEFVHQEFIFFSKYDCERNIPNLMDGLKTSQRKILYSAFKRKLTSEIKVAQFAGYVSEHSLYHHGEASLNKTIVGMAQEFVGSNNINILLPNGQFGTRLQGGKDSASERYIYTLLNQLTSSLFIEHDSNVLDYLDDDGTMVEPEYYAPIIPMILVNGCKGIGTGFSTDVLSYNPSDLVNYIKMKIASQDTSGIKLMPYYEGYSGKIVDLGEKKFLFKGIYEKIGPTIIRITELPVGVWTEDFKTNLEKLMETTDKKGKKITPVVKEYNDMSTDTDIDFTVELHSGMLEKYESKLLPVYNCECNQLEKLLNLVVTKSTNNLHLFDSDQKMRRFEKVEDIIESFYPVRLKMYHKRKEYLIAKLRREVMILHNKARFIEEQCEDIIDLRRKKADVVCELLESRKYDKMEDSYNYLTNMPISSVMEENSIKLREERDKKQRELDALEKKKIENMWIEELDMFIKKYKEYQEKRRLRSQHKDDKKKKSKPKKKLIIE